MAEKLNEQSISSIQNSHHQETSFLDQCPVICDRRSHSRTISLSMYYSTVFSLSVCPRHMHSRRDDAGARPLVSRWPLAFPLGSLGILLSLRSYASPDQTA
jgi:hypothetical protein